MTRKYRQPGYMDYERDDREGKGKRGEPREKKPAAGPRWRSAQDGPRTPRMAGSKTVARCYNCGAVLPALSGELGECGKCGSALRCCKMCTHFDPGSRFECTQPIEARVSPKDRYTSCVHFTLKTTIEKDTSGLGNTATAEMPSAMSPDDARKAFENLFKK